jgi:hypothetical protein
MIKSTGHPALLGGPHLRIYIDGSSSFAGQRRHRPKDAALKTNFSGVRGGERLPPYSYPCENSASS